MPPLRADSGAHARTLLLFPALPVFPTHCRFPRSAAFGGLSAAAAL